jgi:hypothetical protein
MDAVTVRYKQHQDEVKKDPNKQRVPRGLLNQIVPPDQKNAGSKTSQYTLKP